MRNPVLRTGLVIAAVAAVGLVVPGTAISAPFVTTVNGVTITADADAKTLDVSGSGAGDLIGVRNNSATGRYTVSVVGNSDVDTTLPTAGDVAVTIDGGDGNDQLFADLDVGSYGALTIHGRSGGDSISSAPSATRTQLFGDDGDDFIGGDGAGDWFGGAGDDTFQMSARPLVSNASAISGDAGNDTVGIVSGVSAAGSEDVSIAPGASPGHVALHTVAQQAGDAPGVLDLDAATVEVVQFAGGDEVDRVVGAPGLAALLPAGLFVNGGGGGDILTGGDTNDTLLGGGGNDTVSGGGGSDQIEGQTGDDTLLARDGARDAVRGGLGNDSAVIDGGLDGVDGVERLDPAPAPAPDAKDLPATVTSGKLTLVRSHGRFVARVPVSCPAAEAGGCAATLTLQTAKAVRLGAVRQVAVLGSKRVSLKGGQRAVVGVTLAAGAERLAAHGRLAARASILSRDRAGNLGSSARTLTLVVAPTRKRKR